MTTRRHWAEVRKTLEKDLLCDSLKGRVRYFATRYRKAHDQAGRACVLVDKKEIINMPFHIEDDRYAETHARKQDNPDRGFWDIHEEIFDDFAQRGLYYPGDFSFALDEFLSSDIKTSLNSDNWLVRMLAIMDRRTGKRTLQKIKPSIIDLPEWLQYFYQLRLQSEDIH